MVNIFKSVGRILGIYCQSKDMEDFLNLQANLGTLDLNSQQSQLFIHDLQLYFHGLVL